MSEYLDNLALDLLDRADELAPAMSVDPGAVIAAGRRKVRHRQASAATGMGALALVGALWLGGPLNPFAPTGLTGDPVPAAAVSWQEGVDVELFDNAPNPVHEADRTAWAGQLRSDEGDGFPELVLTRDGTQLDPLAAQDGPGEVMVFTAEGLTVAVWQSPPGSRGEAPLWAPGVHAGQGGTVEIDGAQLQYAAAEIVPGGTGELEELYWFTDDAAHASSGAPLDSTVLVAGDVRALVMLDEARQAWGMTDLRHPTGSVHVERLVSGAGLSGWIGQDVTATSVGVLPEGASTPTVTSQTTVLAQAQLGTQTAVLAADPTLVTGPPVIRYQFEGEERDLMSFVQETYRTLDVGIAQLLITAQPTALELRRGDKSTLIPVEDLTDRHALAAPVMGGHVVIVPGWEPDAAAENLRVLVGTDGKDRWVEAESAYIDILFDGRPLVVLGLDRGILQEGETVRGVGIVDADDSVVSHPLDDVTPLNVNI
jgi:predicted RNA-binding protein with TRAM domain